MMEDRFRTDLVLGALLHDLGKVRQRAQDPSERGMTHGEIGYRWLSEVYGEGIVASAARSHHGCNEETWLSNASLLIYEADNCAASERRARFDKDKDQGKEWHRNVQLASVFSRVMDPRAEDQTDVPPPPAYHSLVTLDQWRPPSPSERSNSAEDYKSLWRGFWTELDALKTSGNHRNIDALLHLLEKYTAFVPSITLKVFGTDDMETYRKHPDVSLFDHMKVTAALALCMADYYSELYADEWNRKVLKQEITGQSTREEEQPFLLVGGDLSGVQQFIYTISSKGALRSLKGRSFFLELLTEQVVDRLLEELRLTRCNVIFTGGGRFYLVAANTSGSVETIGRVRGEVNTWLLDDYNGQLQQFIEAVPFSKDDVHEISPVWARLAGELEAAKRKKWVHHLERVLEAPQEPHETCFESSCQVCGREDRELVAERVADDEIRVCDPCGDQMRLGLLLQRAVRKGSMPVLYRWDEPPPIERDKYVRIGGRFLQPAAGMLGQGKEEALNRASAVYHLNDWDLKHFGHARSRPLLAGVYLPREEECRDLEGMARGGLGTERIAVLRMDVDYLGRIFSRCVPAGERTLSRMASLSRQLSLFFKYHINGLLAGEADYPKPVRVSREWKKERLASVVYSGGDDLFLIGHWLDVAEAAFDIEAAFREFTGNPFITLSAGMTLGGIHDPVYRLAEKAGEAESRAKGGEKRSLTLFDRHTFSWPEAHEILGLLRTLNGFGELRESRIHLFEESLSRGFFYRLLQLVREHNRAVREKGKSKIWLLPRLAYTFGRCRPKATQVDAFQALKNYVFSRDVDWRRLEAALLSFLMMMRQGG